ncbi:MAG: magnesium transporter [Pseudomonadota bacterium]
MDEGEARRGDEAQGDGALRDGDLRDGDLRDGDRALDPQLVLAAAAATADGDRYGLKALLDDLHPADVADLFEQLGHERRRSAARLLGPDLSPAVLVELEDDVRDDVVGAVDAEVLQAAARELDPEDVTYLVEDLHPEAQDAVLEALEPVDAAAVRQQLSYPEDSAGRLMRRDFVTAPPFWTVGDMIDRMRALESLPDEFHDVVLVDPAMKPVGLVALSRIMGAQRTRPLDAIKRGRMEVLEAEEPQADVAYAFNQYHVISAPVVDRSGRLVGVVHMEDAMEALDEEHAEDLHRIAGVGDESLSDKIMETMKGRAPWLSLSLVAAMLSAAVISRFEGTIAEITALAILMPVITAMGGNAGTQTLAVTVRALATKDLTAANKRRIIARELLVGLGNGMLFAGVVGLVAYAWFADPALSATLGAAMTVTFFVAALAGIMVPLGLERAGADPAIASGPFVTTMIDVFGFFAFLGLATAVLI